MLGAAPPAPLPRHRSARRPADGRCVDVVAAALAARAIGVPPARVAVQLREKDLSARALLDAGARAARGDRAAGAALYVNDRVDVALAVRRRRRSPRRRRRCRSPTPPAPRPAWRSRCRRTAPADVAAARAAARRRSPSRSSVPCNDTPAKRRYGPPVGVAALADAARLGLPLLAIGGISRRRRPRRCAARAPRGVACIRAIIAAPDPEQSARAFCQINR